MKPHTSSGVSAIVAVMMMISFKAVGSGTADALCQELIGGTSEQCAAQVRAAGPQMEFMVWGFVGECQRRGLSWRDVGRWEACLAAEKARSNPPAVYRAPPVYVVPAPPTYAPPIAGQAPSGVGGDVRIGGQPPIICESRSIGGSVQTFCR